MDATWITVLGFVAASLTTFAFLPQAVKVWKSRSTHDISLAMFVMSCSGIFLWAVYGILRNDLPMTASSVASLAIALFILGMKLKYK